MKFLAVALDYDGTIATNDTLDPQVRIAIAEIRAQNIIVLIVTGRILSELQRVAGDLNFVDAVVAENGATIYFPETGYSRMLGDPAPQNLVQAIRLEGTACTVGECIVEADANEGTRILATLRRLELPLALLFNRGRLMILPQAVSKATGLKEVFKILRLSVHNAVAIGDAENDHELLKSCECGVAVGWGSGALQSAADLVLPGDGPHAIADFLHQLAAHQHIPAASKARRNLLLGHTDNGATFSLAVRHRKVLIAGDTKSGKSWVTGLLCEQLILYGYSLLIIDPEGDYVSLEALPGVIVYGGSDSLPKPRELIRALRHAEVTIVIDLSHTEHQVRFDYVQTLLSSIKVLREHIGLPHCVVLDEAHYFLHRECDERTLRDLQLDFSVLVSYRASSLHPSVLQDAEAILITRESDQKEIHAICRVCGAFQGREGENEWVKTFGELKLGEVAALPVTTESRGGVTRVHLTPRLTPHIRHVAKYVDVPVPERDRFVFWGRNGPSGEYARTLRQLITALENEKPASFERHLKQHDFSRWIADVFGDYPLAKAVGKAEDRCLIEGPAQSISGLIDAIRTRYDLVDPLHGLELIPE